MLRRVAARRSARSRGGAPSCCSFSGSAAATSRGRANPRVTSPGTGGGAGNELDAVDRVVRMVAVLLGDREDPTVLVDLDETVADKVADRVDAEIAALEAAAGR